jgi:hypothetical protein
MQSFHKPMRNSGSFESGIAKEALCLDFPPVVNIKLQMLSVDQKDVMFSLILGAVVRLSVSIV